MTDRQPDDLFDALRERLADYGQEPPAQLWAGIRAQLPPPVAQPQLRRRRRWAPVALLVLLLAVVGSATWYGWKAQQASGTATDSLAAGRVPAAAGRANAESAAERSASAAIQTQSSAVINNHESAATPKATTSDPKLKAPPSATTLTSSAVAATPDSPRVKALNETVARGNIAGARVPIKKGFAVPGRASVAVASAKGTGLSGTRATPETSGIGSAATTTAAASSMPDATEKAVRDEAGRRVARVSSPASHARGAAEASPSAYASSGRPKAALLATAAAGPTAGKTSTRFRRGHSSTDVGLSAGSARSAFGATATKGQPTAYAARRAQETKARGLTRPTRISEAATANNSAHGHIVSSPAQTAKAAANSAHIGAAEAAASAVQQDLRAAEASAMARTVALQLAPVPAPAAAHLVAMAPVSPLQAASRWSVQLLAGPGFTYRYLGTAPAPNTAPAPVRYYSGNAANAVAELERPALGYGAQISLSRALNLHWSLSAGLGYSEYATRLALQQVTPRNSSYNPASPVPSDSLSTIIHSRDTYRFVTVPLRLGYAWNLSGRWRLGLLAGADAAVYVGGSSTEGSACACRAQTWTASNSPYRRVSLGASLGAELHYRLTNRWSLMAQPTATYLLTPLAKPEGEYYPRHLFGGTALLGVSYDLP